MRLSAVEPKVLSTEENPIVTGMKSMFAAVLVGTGGEANVGMLSNRIKVKNCF